MTTQDLKTMYKAFFINEKTKGRNVTFLNAESIEEATLYCLEVFGDNFLEVVKYEGVKRR